MEELINGYKIPKTEKGLRYTWIRDNSSNSQYDVTFDSIEECIEDARYNWDNKEGQYEGVDENGYDELNDCTIERPIILIGVEHNVIDKVNIQSIIDRIDNVLSDILYRITIDDICVQTDIKHRLDKEEFQKKLKKFINDNIEFYPKKFVECFSLRYDLLNNQWIK